LQAATIHLAPPDRKGVANATFFTAFDLGIGLGTVILGFISDAMGYRVLFGVCAISAAIGLVITIVLARRLLSRRVAAR
jgi:predicted MFS family arabinose efflux permease